MREYDTPQVLRLQQAFGKESIVVGDIVLLEVLQGAVDDLNAVKIEHLLRRFLVLPMLDPDSAIRAGRNYRLLRQRGVTVRKTADMIIGTFCLDRGLPLLHADRDFTHMEQHLGLMAVAL